MFEIYKAINEIFDEDTTGMNEVPYNTVFKGVMQKTRGLVNPKLVEEELLKLKESG